MTRHAKGLLITALGVLIISPDGLLTRLIHTDHWTMIFWRAIFLAFGMWLVVSFMHPNRVWPQYRTLWGRGLWMVMGYAIGTISFIFAITHTSVANTLVILSTTPLFAAVIGRVFMAERIEPRTLVAIVLVSCGIAVMASGSGTGGASLIGDGAALFGAFCLAANFSFVRRYPDISSYSAISCSGVLTALLMLPFAAPLSVTQSDMGFLLIMGYLIPIGTALMFIGPRYIPAAEVGLLLLLESILGPVWVWLALDEAPGERTLIGGAIVLCTLALNTAWALKTPRAAIAR